MAFFANSVALANDVTPCGFEDDAYVYLDTVKISALESVYRIEAGKYADGYGPRCTVYKTKAMFSNGMFYQEILSQNTGDTEKDYLKSAKEGQRVVVKIRVTRRYREVIEFVENLSLH